NDQFGRCRYDSRRARRRSHDFFAEMTVNGRAREARHHLMSNGTLPFSELLSLTGDFRSVRVLVERRRGGFDRPESALVAGLVRRFEGAQRFDELSTFHELELADQDQGFRGSRHALEEGRHPFRYERTKRSLGRLKITELRLDIPFLEQEFCP